jgi:hypothetical protein
MLSGVVCVMAMAAAAAAVACLPLAGASFVHPGVFVNADRLTSIRQQVLDDKSGPVYDAYQKALASRYGPDRTLINGPPASGVIECGPYSQ